MCVREREKEAGNSFLCKGGNPRYLHSPRVVLVCIRAIGHRCFLIQRRGASEQGRVRETIHRLASFSSSSSSPSSSSSSPLNQVRVRRSLPVCRSQVTHNGVSVPIRVRAHTRHTYIYTLQSCGACPHVRYRTRVIGHLRSRVLSLSLYSVSLYEVNLCERRHTHRPCLYLSLSIICFYSAKSAGFRFSFAARSSAHAVVKVLTLGRAAGWKIALASSR